MASLTGELSSLCGFNSPDVCSGTDARFPFLNKRCAFRCEWPFRPTLLSPKAAPIRRRLIADFIRICLFCEFRDGALHDVLFAEFTKKANPNEVSNQSSSYRCRFWTQECRPEGPLTPECAALIEQGEAGDRK